ncbi:uncharacterized protein ACA1_027760 [Acanthamoeba castellanii str. Neff]|uniref:Uncharacterized protein n=1 Tax=Acanthamoeba castellanii (strain ATCC 30010 / Neff) TaxID=1257118 RepID=L8HJ35_ACACF|nr:uncharacterized protein ACA1_027760 [Acanthamoeba castellanii str. Neff]ELR25599.1 hypothetical protein ACA1_027760 [Acanthamoeba castellanii str. Neff]
MLKTIIFVVACLCLFSAQALAQTTTTQTVEATNASVAYEGDAVGEPTVKSANATGEWVVFGLLVLDIVGFVYLFHHSGAKPGSTSTDTDKSIVYQRHDHKTSPVVVAATAAVASPVAVAAEVSPAVVAAAEVSPAVAVVAAAEVSPAVVAAAEVSPAVAVVAAEVSPVTAVIAEVSPAAAAAVVAVTTPVKTAQKVVSVSATSSAASLQSFLSFLF